MGIKPCVMVGFVERCRWERGKELEKVRSGQVYYLCLVSVVTGKKKRQLTRESTYNKSVNAQMDLPDQALPF